MAISKYTIILLFGCCPFLNVLAQVYHPDHYMARKDHFEYFNDSSNSQIYQFISTINGSQLATEWKFKILSPSIGTSFNSGRPFGYNDGAIWRGKGLTTDFSLGFSTRRKNIQFTLYPRIFWSQNSDFDLAPRLKLNKSVYAYQFNMIGDLDYVMRYGSSPFVHFDWGQSELRYRNKWFAMALSTANFTLGPGSQHSILMSRQAGGFPHIELGTNEYIRATFKEIELGSFLFKNRLGQLIESRYYDMNKGNDDRFINILTVGYKPHFLKGFQIGVNRVFYQDMKFVETKDLFRGFWYFNNRDNVPGINGDTVNDRFDQMASIFFEYTLKNSGIRIFGEFVKNDFNGSFRDFLISTGHARGYTLGFDKVFDNDKGQLMLTYETSNVSRSGSFTYRPEPSFYMHYQSLGGYTQRGQLLGLGTGPGSNVHTFSIKQLNDVSLLEASVHRVQIDEDFFQEVYGFWNQSFTNRELRAAEYAVFLSYTNWKNKWSYTIDVSPSVRINHDFVNENDRANLYTGITLNYLL